MPTVNAQYAPCQEKIFGASAIQYYCATKKMRESSTLITKAKLKSINAAFRGTPTYIIAEAPPAKTF
jgi:hypothetical protein